MLASCQTDPNQQNNDTETIVDTIPSVEIDTTPGLVFDKEKYTWEDGYIVMDWQFLSRIVFDDKYINDTLAMVPIFHDDIKVLEGKPLQISGYLIPFGEETGKLHFLSAFPMSQCFFCGAAGPESVMDVMTIKEHHDFNMDDQITFRGKLHLNDYNLDYMNYILKDAELIKRKKAAPKKKGEEEEEENPIEKTNKPTIIDNGK